MYDQQYHLLTSAVSGLVDAIWPDTHIAEPRWNDESLMSVLADALEEAGCTDAEAISAMRTSNTVATHKSHWGRMPLISQLREGLRKMRQEQAASDLARAHTAATAEIVAALEHRSKEAYAAREVRNGYRRKCRAALIAGTPGYVEAITHDLRGTPPPGVIWIRWSSGGKWSVSRRAKFGRALTVAELMRLIAR